MRRDEVTGAPLSPTSFRSRGDTTSTLYPAYVPPEGCRAIVPYVPPMPPLVPPSDSGNQTLPTFPEGGIAAEISVDTTGIDEEDQADLESLSDDEVSTGSGFVYNEEVLNDLFTDKYGQRRQDMEKKKQNCLGPQLSWGERPGQSGVTLNLKTYHTKTSLNLVFEVTLLTSTASRKGSGAEQK